MKDQLKLSDWILALVVGVFVSVLLFVFSVPGLDPALWEEAAIVQGLLPPKSFFPGAWRYLPGAMSPAMGALGGGVLAFLVAMCVRAALVILARPNVSQELWRKWYAPALTAAGAILAATADPVWRSCQVFTPTLYQMIGYAGVFFLFVRWLNVGQVWRLYLLMFLLGLLAAESAHAFIVMLGLGATFALTWKDIYNGFFKPEGSLPETSRLPKWRMLLFFMLGLLILVVANVQAFIAAGGCEATGWGHSDVAFRYVYAYIHSILGAATIAGWLMALVIGVVPLFLTTRILITRVSDEEPIPFSYGLGVAVAGAIALCQALPFPAVWFWRWSANGVAVADPLVLSMSCLFSAVAAIFAISCFVIENRGRAEDFEGATRFLLRVWGPTLVVVSVVCALWGVYRPGIIAMQRLVDDAVAETVREMGDTEWIFTDGSCDAGLELEAARQGKTVRPLNMMSTAAPRDLYLRLRGLTDEADKGAAEQGVPVMLRVWAGEKENGMARASVQLGFEFWKRANKEPPIPSGLLARENWKDKEEYERGRAAADALAMRILEISKRTDIDGASAALRRVFADISWRLSRFARQRQDATLADKLDAVNSALKQMLKTVEYERIRIFMQLTPREGLELALRRADFVEARRYASAVLKADEKDPDANFGLGMSYLLENRLSEAEFYLERCLKVRPEEPAVLNNLSIIYRKTGRYEKAFEFAVRAKKYLPENKDVATTYRDAEEALKEFKAREKKPAAR